MADVANTLPSWSTTRSSNQPQGSTTVGTGWDDNIREIQGVARSWLASKGSDIASASTTDIGAVEGLFHDITGTTTITGFGTVSTGIWKILKFEGALTLTHNATSLILPTGANITTADGDMLMATSEGSGNWRINWYVKANGQALGFNITGLTAETSPDVADELPMYDTSEGANNKMTFSNFLKVINVLTEDTSPDGAADYVATYDGSASAAKKILLSRVIGGTILLDTKTAAVSSSLDFTSFITSTYDEYIFEVYGLVPATDNTDLRILISQDGGSSWKTGGTDYRFGRYIIGESASTQAGSGAAAFMNSIDALSNSTGAGTSGQIRLYTPSSTALTKAFDWTYSGWVSGGGIRKTVGAGRYVTDTAAINGVRFIMSSGNITSGVIRMFGVRNS